MYLDDTQTCSYGPETYPALALRCNLIMSIEDGLKKNEHVKKKKKM